MQEGQMDSKEASYEIDRVSGSMKRTTHFPTNDCTESFLDPLTKNKIQVCRNLRVWNSRLGLTESNRLTNSVNCCRIRWLQGRNSIGVSVYISWQFVTRPQKLVQSRLAYSWH